MDKVGLVLEGGGMRGIYTSGVLDYFMENNFYPPYVIGVSAGACNALYFVSKQIGHSKKAIIGCMDNPKLISNKNMISDGCLLPMDFLFDVIPNQLVPFDYDAFYHSTQECIICTTSCETGQPFYFAKKDCEDLMMVCRASSSLPFVSPIVEINDKPLLDGGIADPIPIVRAIMDGNERNVAILTRDKEYRKTPNGLSESIKKAYPQYPKLQEVILNRYKKYNETLDYIEQLEKENKVFAIRPMLPVNIDRMEKDTEKLTQLYNSGYEDARAVFPKLLKWVHKS
jgi:predicted patatin/cPLA2 family phospholipase